MKNRTRVIAGFVFFLSGTFSAAADYPSRPITLVVPYAAGGSNDSLSRVVAERMGFEIPESSQRTPQVLQALVQGEVVRWKTVLKGIDVPAN